MSTTSHQLFDALDAATEAALRESVQRWGVLVPVMQDQHGNVIDGHQRSRVADELGVDYRVDVVPVQSEEEARELAFTVNADRRQLPPSKRREIAAALHEQGHSMRAIAASHGVDETTIRRDLAGAAGAAPERVLGRDGKSYPAKRTVVAAKTQKEAGRAQEALAGLSQPPTTVLDVGRVERLAREEEAQKRRDEPVEPLSRQDLEIVHADFREGLAGFDLAGATIITDPPYPREFLEEWSTFALLALDEWRCSQLVAMCGQTILPNVLERLTGAGWNYRWTFAYLTVGPAARVWGANVGSWWKPVLAFDQPGFERPFVTSDLLRSSGDDKRHHPWGQNEDGVAQIVEALTKPGDLVVDPFLGGGTTAVVCAELGRRFVGCDIDAAAISRTRERLSA